MSTTLLIAALLLGCGTTEDVATEAPVPRVAVAEAQPAPDRFERELSGILEARRDTTLSARAGGTVTERVAEPGTRVEDGAVLLRFDSREASAAYGQAKAAVSEAEAALEDAKSRWERVERMGDLVSSQDATSARSGFQRAEAALERAKSQRDLAGVQLSYLTVRAPFAGEVASLEPEVGETVAPGSPVARVVDVDGLEVTVGLLGDEVAAARDPGSRFEVVVGGESVAATLEHVPPAADPQTLTWPVELAVPSGPTRIPGQPVTVRASLASGGVGVEVPVQALRGSDRMWVVEDGQVRGVTVRVLRERSATLVVEGVDAGSLVVTRGPRDLEEGTAVQVLDGGEG